jgi:hypothetical protein
MDRSSLIFCVSALVVTLGLSAALYPVATISAEEVAAARTPVLSEDLPDLDLGDFGTVSISELVGYYVENPPAPVAAGGAGKQVRFQGC